MKSAQILSLVALIGATLVSGCGGNGGGSSLTAATKASPTVSVDWPLRTRNLVGPSSALSASFTLHPLTVPGSDITFVGDRASNLAAHTDAYTTTSQGYVGEWQLTATFYANAGEAGAVVGTATTQVDLTSTGALQNITGQALGPISFSPTIYRAVVNSSQTVPYFTPTLLTATAYDANSNVVAVTPGSFKWTQVSGSTNFSLGADGTATALLNGTGTVTATIDGITTSSTTVTVVPQTLAFNYQANGFSYDPSRGCVYVAAFNYPAAGQSAILKVSSTTGAILSSLSMSSVQSLLVTSNDGTHLYSLADSGTITQINLSTFAIAATGSLPNSDAPVTAIPLASGNDTWAVSLKNSIATDDGTYIFDGLTNRASSVPMGFSIAADSTGTIIYGCQIFTFSSTPRTYTVASVDSTGLTQTLSVTSPMSSSTAYLHFLDNLIVGDDGSVVTPSTGVLSATLAVPGNGVICGSPTLARAYFAASSPAELLSFDLPSHTLVNTYSLPTTITGNLRNLTFAGTGTVAFSSVGGSPNNQFFLVGGLP